MNGRVAVGVMAKAPLAGRSKTRLCPPLAPDQAAALSAAFLHDITAGIAAAGRVAPIDAFVAYAPAGDEALFDGHLAPGTRLLLADGSGGAAEGVEGFGRCLLHAMRAMLGLGYTAACVLNADSPTLPAAYLPRMAALVLAPPAPAVLGPAEDGGYCLLAARSADPRLFAGIAWSTDGVAAATRRRIAQAGLVLAELPPWYDVDDRHALARLERETAGLALPGTRPGPAPATARALARIGRGAGLPMAAE